MDKNIIRSPIDINDAGHEDSKHDILQKMQQDQPGHEAEIQDVEDLEKSEVVDSGISRGSAPVPQHVSRSGLGSGTVATGRLGYQHDEAAKANEDCDEDE